MSKSICPTCGEKRWIPEDFEECVECRRTTLRLIGKPADMRKGTGECGWVKQSVFRGEHRDPFETQF